MLQKLLVSIETRKFGLERKCAMVQKNTFFFKLYILIKKNHTVGTPYSLFCSFVLFYSLHRAKVN